MKLYNVRKGQFVYYNNLLHKVYSVKPFFKQSVHLIRLRDFKQQLATAKEIDLYKPKHLDSFIFNHQRYTLHKSVKAQVGDYILVINPSPDYLDQHHLHAIEVVATIENNGIISNKSNGIKHHEYWVMIPELLDGANIIDLQDPQLVSINEQDDEHDATLPEDVFTKIGDVFRKNNSDIIIQTMVIAVKGNTVFLGGGLEITKNRLMNSEHWSFVYNVLEK